MKYELIEGDSICVESRLELISEDDEKSEVKIHGFNTLIDVDRHGKNVPRHSVLVSYKLKSDGSS